MNSITCSSLVYTSIAKLSGLCNRAPTTNLNFTALAPAMQALEENFHAIVNGYNPYTDCFINEEDGSVHATEGVEYLLLNQAEEFKSLLGQALYTARALEMAFEEMGEMDNADVAHHCRRQLVAAKHGSFNLLNGPIEA